MHLFCMISVCIELFHNVKFYCVIFWLFVKDCTLVYGLLHHKMAEDLEHLNQNIYQSLGCTYHFSWYCNFIFCQYVISCDHLQDQLVKPLSTRSWFSLVQYKVFTKLKSAASIEDWSHCNSKTKLLIIILSIFLLVLVGISVISNDINRN